MRLNQNSRKAEVTPADARSRIAHLEILRAKGKHDTQSEQALSQEAGSSSPWQMYANVIGFAVFLVVIALAATFLMQ